MLAFLCGLVFRLVFASTLIATLNQCLRKYLNDAPRLYFTGRIPHAEFAAFHKETPIKRALMDVSAFLAVLAFVAGVAFAAWGMLAT